MLVQGNAPVIEKPSEAERGVVREHATDTSGRRKEGFFWDRWLREYYVTRVPVRSTSTRMVTWPTLDCAGTPEARPGSRFPQARRPAAPPKSGIAPRVDVARAAKRLRGTAHTLLGYTGADGRPVVVPVSWPPTTSAACSGAPLRRRRAGGAPGSSATATGRS